MSYSLEPSPCKPDLDCLPLEHVANLDQSTGNKESAPSPLPRLEVPDSTRSASPTPFASRLASWARTHPDTYPRNPLELPEILEQILCNLPIEELATSRQVCRAWYDMVEESQMLLERHFVSGWKRNVPAPVRYQELSTTPLLVNPLMRRRVLLPSFARGKRQVPWGSFLSSSELEPFREGALESSESRVDGSTSVREAVTRREADPGYGFRENLLDTVQSKSEDAKGKAAKGDRSEAPTIALVDAAERPIRDGFKDEPILAPRSGPTYVPEHAPKRGQVKWKTLLLTQPPVTDITIRAPESQVAIHYWKNCDVSMGDLLDALEDLKNEWPDRWPDPIRHSENGGGREELEFELALPLMGKDGEPAKRANGNAVWRALKTRLKCRIAEEVTTVDPKMLSKSPPLSDPDS
ncbi:hypothetical protein KC357_g4286 [Hortaea werneckii]|nr:hypothetical protein KC357_g4286 [Hortaea werneckii]KAI7482519.1 hypothetical protein KC351_g5673 [Hortaea werneckii]